MADVTKIGNLTSDPELRFTPNGKAVCNFDIAYNHYNPETKTTDDPVYYRITIWEQMGENTAQSLQKGDRVVVTGRPEQREWETKDGEKRIQKTIIASGIGADLRFATCAVTRTVRNAPQPLNEEQEEMF